VLDRVLPRTIDNEYRGHPGAIWIFVPVLLLKTGIALGSMLDARDAAQAAAGIALGSFGAAGADAVVTLFTLLGLSQLVFVVLGVLALVRYRAMIPLVFLMILLEQAARRWILQVMPIARTGAPPSIPINLVLLVLMAGGLALSLRRRAG